MSAYRPEFEPSLDAILKAKVEVALADAAPSIPQAEVFDALRIAHAKPRLRESKTTKFPSPRT